MRKPYHVLQVFPSFCPGGAQVRFTRLANAFGPEFSYTVLSMDGNFEAAQLVDSSITLDLVSPETKTLPASAFWIRRLIQQVRPKLTITNNWGSMDAVFASWVTGLCPTIHSEDGFGAEEAERLKARRVLTRRILLNRIQTTVVPSKTLLRIAREQYRIQSRSVTYIPNGIDVTRFRPHRCHLTRRMLGADDETTIIGFIGHLRPEKTLNLLIDAYAMSEIQKSLLVVVGDGPCHKDLVHLVTRHGLSDCVRFVGHVTDPHPYLSAFDIFAISSATEQMPFSVLEAMAYGLPVICTNVGDCAEMLATCEFPVIVPPSDVTAYAQALKLLATAPDLRQHLGTANRQRCITTYSFEAMVSAYSTLYRTLLT